MGLFLTLLYILTAFLSPTLLFGELAQYHIEIVLAILTLLASLPSLPGSGVLRAPQTVAIAGMIFAVVASFVFAGLTGLAPAALYDFLPGSFAFFLVALNCNSRRRLQMVVLTLVLASGFVIVKGGLALRAGEVVSPYLYDQGYDGNHILRLRGLNFVNDPNDLGQVLISLVPLMFLFWKPKKLLWNIPFVLFPAAFLLVGIFLTHSRGALLALLAVIAIAMYRRFGIVPAGVVAVAAFAAATALSWSGGREINAEAGSDRMAAWSTGLELIRSHPIFGVGYLRFTEYNDITAHNTIVVCAAELGFVGFFFWVLFVVSSVRQAVVLRTRSRKRADEQLAAAAFSYASPALQYQTAAGAPDATFLASSHSAHGVQEAGEKAGFSPPLGFVDEGGKVESEASIRQMAWILTVGFLGFLVAGWFLSRAYVMWLFIYGGMGHVIYRMAVERGIAPPPPPLSRLLKISFGLSIVLLMVVYLILRLKKFLPAG